MIHVDVVVVVVVNIVQRACFIIVSPTLALTHCCMFALGCDTGRAEHMLSECGAMPLGVPLATLIHAGFMFSLVGFHAFP